MLRKCFSSEAVSSDGAGGTRRQTVARATLSVFHMGNARKIPESGDSCLPQACGRGMADHDLSRGPFFIPGERQYLQDINSVKRADPSTLEALRSLLRVRFRVWPGSDSEWRRPGCG